jgi:hypothetical protein
MRYKWITSVQIYTKQFVLNSTESKIVSGIEKIINSNQALGRMQIKLHAPQCFIFYTGAEREERERAI